MSKVYEVAFKIGADMAASFAKTMSGASGALGELNKSMAALSKQQGANKRVIDLRESLAKTSQEFNMAKQRVAELGEQMARTKTPTRAMTRQYDQAQRAVERARGRMQHQAQTLREVTREAGAAGKSTAQLVAEQEQLARAGERAAKSQAALQRNVAAQQANMQKRAGYRSQIVDVVAMTAPVVVAVKQAMEWEQRLAEFNKVAGKSREEVEAIAAAAQEMAVSTGVAREEIMGAYIAAAQAGFDESEWEKYAEVAAKMGVAFDISGEAAGEMIKAWRSSMGLSMDDAEALAAAANHIANNMNATAEGIGIVLQRQGAVMKTAGLSDTQSAAFAAALLSSGASPEQVSTSARNIMQALVKGSSATKAEQEALKALGFHDPVRLAKAMQKAPEEAIMRVLTRIGNLAKHEQASVIGQLFGADAMGAVAPLVGNLDVLADAFGLVQDKSQYIDSLEQEFEAMGATTINQMNKMRESLKVITTTIGSTLLPTLNQLLATMAPIALEFAKFAKENEGVIKAAMLTAGGLVALKVAAFASGYAWTFVKGAALSAQGVILSLHTAILKAAGAFTAKGRAQMAATASTKAMAAAQWLLNTAMLANPIGVVIAAVMGLVAAGALLYKYWDVIVAFLKGAWAGLKEGLEPLFEALQPLTPLLDGIKAAAGWVADAFRTIVGWFGKTEHSAETLEAAGEHGKAFGKTIAAFIKLATSPIIALIDLISWLYEQWQKLPDLISEGLQAVKDYLSNFSLFDMGKKLLSTLSDGIKAAASVPVEAVKGALSKVRDMLPFSDAKVGPLSELTYSGMQVMRTLTDGIKSASLDPAGAVEQGLSRVAGGLSGFAERGVSNAGAGATNITINQEIKIAGGDGNMYEQAKRGASDGARDLLKDLQRALAREGRLSYG